MNLSEMAERAGNAASSKHKLEMKSSGGECQPPKATRFLAFAHPEA
jgi:hypothetical protein